MSKPPFSMQPTQTKSSLQNTVHISTSDVSSDEYENEAFAFNVEHSVAVAASSGAAVQPLTGADPVEQLQTLTNNLDLSAVNPEPDVTPAQVYSSTSNPFPPLTRPVELPAEPSSADTDAVLLAVKLPDGRRMQRRFRKSDELRSVLHFAEVSAQLDFSATVIVCDAPRRLFTDLCVKLSDTELQNRTVLHLQLPDE